MTALGQANPFFVRCLKPNVAKVKDTFLPQTVLNQLKYSGMMETVRIRRLGYPVRRVFDDFLFRYNVLGRSLQLEGKEPKDCCGLIMSVHDNTKKNWQVGKTKVKMWRPGQVTMVTMIIHRFFIGKIWKELWRKKETMH